jgi:hypothetical protein
VNNGDGCCGRKEGKRVLIYLSQELGLTKAETSDLLVSFADRCLAWAAGRIDSHESPVAGIAIDMDDEKPALQRLINEAVGAEKRCNPFVSSADISATPMSMRNSRWKPLYLTCMTARSGSTGTHRPGGIDFGKVDGRRKNSPDRRLLRRVAVQVAHATHYTAFLRGLRLCQLHQAIQWLGWSRDWTPPTEHPQDWLATARQAVEQLAG